LCIKRLSCAGTPRRKCAALPPRTNPSASRTQASTTQCSSPTSRRHCSTAPTPNNIAALVY
jgi:hypothetical protein